MADFRARNIIITAKKETTKGTDATPTVGSNAIKARFPANYAPNIEVIDSDEATGSLSQSAPQIGGGNASMPVSVLLKGPGSGNEGSAPESGVLFEGGGMSETLTAADVSDTAQAGAASAITLASGASATDDIYKGMPITLDGGTGSGQTRVVTAYNGTTKVATVYPAWDTEPDATSEYSVLANALYRPVSQGLEALTLYQYQRNSDGSADARLRKLLGAMGAWSLRLAPRRPAEVEFRFTGQFPGAPTDVTDPGDPTYADGDARPFIGADAWLGGAQVKFTEFSLDFGLDVQQFDDPAQAYGFEPADILGRQPTGRLTPNLVLNSARNAFSDFLAGTDKQLWLRWGSVAGERISVWLPSIRYTGNEPGESRGFAVEGLPFRAHGENAEVWISFY